MAQAIPLLNSLQPQYSALQGGVPNLQGGGSSALTLQPTYNPNPSSSFVGPVLPSLPKSTPLTVAPAPKLPTIAVPKVGYSNLTNDNGTIVNDITGFRYPKPDQLAADLGLGGVNQIMWDNIKKLTAPQAPAPAIPQSGQDYSTLGYSSPVSSSNPYQVTPSGTVVNPSTGGVVSPAGSISPTLPSTIYDNPEYTDILKKYLDLQKLSPDEESTTNELNNIISGLGITKANQSNQPIAMEFITGQQAASEKRALALATPLQQKMALLQSKREGAIAASKFALDTTEKKLQAQLDAKTAADKLAADRSKPMEISPGGTLIDPSTGRLIYQAPNKPDTANDPNRILSATEAQTLGVPFGTTAGQAYGKTVTKPLTEAQSKDLTYASRAEPANGTIGSLESQVANYNSALWLAATKAENTTLGNSFVPDWVKQIRQAERNFGTAILRRESGAAISASEFDTMEKQYFPRPGDDPGTLQQKAQNRQIAIDSFKQSAGPGAFGNNNNSSLDSVLDAIGFNKGGGGTPKATMRTDKNNNPTAMTTDVARELGLVYGVDYVQGAKFPGNSNLYTARLLGDPVAITIKGLDQGGFYTRSGKQRWSYIGIPQAQWNKMSYSQKVAVVKTMYKREGNTGVLNQYFA